MSIRTSTRIAKLVKYSLIAIGFTAAGVLLVISSIALSFLIHYIEGHELPLALSIIGVVLAISITIILAINKRIRKIFRWRSLNFRWFIILPISILPSLIISVIYILPLDFDNLVLESTSSLHFLLVSASTLILLIVGYMIYFNVLSLKLRTLKKVKFWLLTIFAILLLLGSSIGFQFLHTNFFTFPSANILAGNGHNDGPWLTWYNNKPNESICISWLTAQSNSSILYYGITPSNLNQTAIGSGNYLHKVYLEGLNPDTTYFYYIPESFEQAHASTIFNFTTASSTQTSFKFAIVGDMQPSNALMESKAGMVADGLIKEDFDFICQLGDLTPEGSVPENWHRVFNSLARVAANTPIQAAIGNHDWDTLAVGSSNWADLFSYPYSNPSLGRYYSFDYQNAHFVILDNFEHVSLMSDIQLNWMRADITQAQARGQDWVFVFLHLSLLSTATIGMQWNLQQKLLPIFDELAVDAVFFGHDHDYEHYNYTYGGNGLVYDNSHDWTHNEVHYFCSGGGGANLEVDYGVLNEEEMLETSIVRWWDENLNQYQDISYERRPWNSSKYFTNNSLPENYTHWAPADLGKYYYHLPQQEVYHDAAQQFGLQYGEQAYHYIQVEVNGTSCTISARYPSGDLLIGPGGAYPQQWTFIKL